MTTEAMHLVECITRRIATVIEGSEQQRTRQQQAQVDAALAKVGRKLACSLNTADLFERLCQLATEVLGCDYSCLLLWQPLAAAYIPAACHGVAGEQWATLRRLTLSGAVMGTFIERLERETTIQVRTSLVATAPGAALSLKYGASASIHVVLRRGTETIGFLAAGYRRRSESFTPQQEHIARGIAQLASVTLETVERVDELQRASRLKSELVATVSHELRTSLNIILGYNDLLLEHAFGPLTVEQTATLQQVGKSAHELFDVINSTLDLSRVETGRISLDLHETHVGSVLREIEAETQPLRQKPELTFACHVPTALAPLHTDPVKLKVVLKNLIVNALKFTDEGSVTVRVVGRDGGMEISVADTGIGMTPETLRMIFEPFCQADRLRQRGYGGVGLGLYIVRRLLEMLGGTIRVQSKLGRGSIFRVWVPSALLPAGEQRIS